MFEGRTKIKESLEKVSKDSLASLATPLFVSHLLWGRLSDRGSVRFTEIGVKSDQLGAESLFNFDFPQDAFIRHINRVGRSNQFANYLHSFFFENGSFSGKQYRTPSVSFKCRINEGNVPIEYQVDKGRHHELSLSRDFADRLLSKSLLTKYVKSFLTRKDADVHLDADSNKSYSDRWIQERITYSRHATSEYLKQAIDSTSLDQLFFPFASEEDKVLSFLNVLQTLLLYRVVESPTQSTGFIYQGICINYGDSPSFIENPVVLLSTTFQGEDELDSITQENKRAFSNIERVINQTRLQGVTPLNQHIDYGKACPITIPPIEEFYEEIRKRVTSRFKYKFNPLWAINLIVWNTVLVELLRTSVHEGKRLGFTFVIGNISEVIDSGLFDSHELAFGIDTLETNIFHPWQETSGVLNFRNDKTFDQVTELVKKTILKKNYPWFQDGRYALLWDSTFPSANPYGLISPKQSSWHIVLDQFRNREKIGYSNLSIAIIYVREDGTGGLTLSDKEIASFTRKSRWKLADEIQDDGKRLRELLKKSIGTGDPFGGMKEELLSRMSDALMRVSENPHTGCILVVRDKDDGDMFSSMGSPWTCETFIQKDVQEAMPPKLNPLNISPRELSLLMGMDGATCVTVAFPQPEISFRNFVMKAPSKEGLAHARKFLDGEGSRKWSAGIASSETSVSLVVAVSQDGPILAYFLDETNNELKIEEVFSGL